MYIAASTRCFFDTGFEEACQLISDLEFDKGELWLDENGAGLKPSEVHADPDVVCARFRDASRLTPVALQLEHDVEMPAFAAIIQFAKQLKITQITIHASPIGTPFNSEIDRLRAMADSVIRDGIRLSIKTMSGHLTEDPHTAVELCESVRGLGLTLDPSYYVARQASTLNYDFVLPHVYHVHLRDTSETQLQVPVGLGNIDYGRLITQLRGNNFNGVLSIDLIPEQTDIETRALEMRKLRLLLESLY